MSGGWRVVQVMRREEDRRQETLIVGQYPTRE